MHDSLTAQLHAAYLEGDLATVEALLGPTRDMLSAALDEMMGPPSSGFGSPVYTDEPTVSVKVAA